MIVVNCEVNEIRAAYGNAIARLTPTNALMVVAGGYIEIAGKVGMDDKGLYVDAPGLRLYDRTVVTLTIEAVAP